MAIKWCGIDFGQCLMEPTGLRTYLVVGDVCKEMCMPENIKSSVRRFRILAEACGGHSKLKEAHRDKIKEYVFGGDDRAMEIFSNNERKYLSVGNGAMEAFEFLRKEGIEINIVAELKKTLGKVGNDIISKFVTSRHLVEYFHCMYTPQGKVDFHTGERDDRYVSKTKESGKMYDQLIEELEQRGIAPNEMVMVGDKIATDIVPARQRGIRTVQYTGYVDMGDSEADFKVRDFHGLKEVIQELQTQ